MLFAIGCGSDEPEPTEAVQEIADDQVETPPTATPEPTKPPTNTPEPTATDRAYQHP